MEYKILVRVFAPEIEEEYEVYIPINKTIEEVSRLLDTLINNLSGSFPLKPAIQLYNRKTGESYNRLTLIRDTDIRNGTELILLA